MPQKGVMPASASAPFVAASMPHAMPPGSNKKNHLELVKRRLLKVFLVEHISKDLKSLCSWEHLDISLGVACLSEMIFLLGNSPQRGFLRPPSGSLMPSMPMAAPHALPPEHSLQMNSAAAPAAGAAPAAAESSSSEYETWL